jgi:hypothetical protein
MQDEENDMHTADLLLLLDKVQEHLRQIQPSLDAAGYRTYTNARLLEDVWDAISSIEAATEHER